MNTTLKERVNERMLALGMKNAQLAKLCDVKPPTSFNWASGKTKNIKGEPLFKAAKALGVTANWLESGKGPKFPVNDPVPGGGLTVQEPTAIYQVSSAGNIDHLTLEIIQILSTIDQDDKRAVIANIKTFIHFFQNLQTR